jgi:chorismate mutase
LKVAKAKKKNGKSVRREWMKADLKIKDHSRPERLVAKYRRQLGERSARAEGLTYLSVQMVSGSTFLK